MPTSVPCGRHVSAFCRLIAGTTCLTITLSMAMAFKAYGAETDAAASARHVANKKMFMNSLDPCANPDPEQPAKQSQSARQTADAVSNTPAPGPCPERAQTLGNDTFYVRNGRIYDHTNHEFVMRGVNVPNAYYLKQSEEAVRRIADFGFNTVRMIWCADTLKRSGRCDKKDIFPLKDLERFLSKLRENELVAVLNLQNATGSDDPDDLQKLVDWLLKDEVKDLLDRYRDMLIINIANEWHGSWDDDDRVYVTTYAAAIRRLRDAGLRHTLIIDARGWGQQFESIPEHAAELLAVDDNLIFSSHLYDQYSESKRVRDIFRQIRDRKIPFIIGEFACSHYPSQTVACETIMEEASRSDAPFGYVGWSYSGNSYELSALDITFTYDWKTLTPWGEKLVNSPNGVAATGHKACLFPGANCSH